MTIALNILYVPYNAKHVNEQDNDYDGTKEIRMHINQNIIINAIPK